jgi:hypothetical protein
MHDVISSELADTKSERLEIEEGHCEPAWSGLHSIEKRQLTDELAELSRRVLELTPPPNFFD